MKSTFTENDRRNNCAGHITPQQPSDLAQTSQMIETYLCRLRNMRAHVHLRVEVNAETIKTMQPLRTVVIKLQATAISIETRTNQTMQTQTVRCPQNLTARPHGQPHTLIAVDERCMTVRKHGDACSECPLLQVFKNAIVVGRLGSGPTSLVGWGQELGLVPVFKKCPSRESDRVRTPPRGSDRVRSMGQ